MATQNKWELIEKNGETYQSSLDNKKEIPWIKKQIQQELSDLKNIAEGVNKNEFFKENNDIVVYNLDLVKRYLEYCLKKEKLQLTPTVIIAVQIALESLHYDVGVIDWLLWTPGSNTRKAVEKFQREWNANCKDQKDQLSPDWIPWKNTIGKLVQILWGTSNENIPDSQNTAVQQTKPKEWSIYAPDLLRKPREPVKSDTLLEQPKLDSKSDQEINNDAETPITTNTHIQPEFQHNNHFYLQNRDEYINNADILQWPKLKATNPDQVWWIGSSMMVGFSGYGKVFKNMKWITWATTRTRNKERYWKEWQNGSLDRNALQKYCETKWIKSFVLYFGWNEAANSWTSVNNAYNDIENIWECLESFWVQPVLCTCIWEKKPEHSPWRNWQQYPLVEFNQRIRDLWEQRNRPVMDYASIDVGNVRYSNYSDTHPGNPWYRAMGQKIIDNLSV